MSELDEVIVRVLQGRAVLEEQQRVRLWRREHPDHEAHYRGLEALWALTGAVAPDYSDPVPLESLMHAAMKQRSSDPPLRGKGTTDAAPEELRLHAMAHGLTRRRRIVTTLLAAGIAGLLVVGALQLNRPRDGVLSEGAIATGPGEMTTITLSDASSIRLAPNSRLRLSETRDLRIAWLEGRAFFGIHSDEDRPFVVYTEYGEARVLGTRFEVNTTEEEFAVLVVEGTVEVSAGGTDVDVSAGQMTRSEGGGQPVATPVSDVYERLDWIGNAVVFQATPLSVAVQELESRFSVDVEVVDPRLEDVRVTAAFSGESASEVLRVVCEVINAVCAFDGSRVQIGT